MRKAVHTCTSDLSSWFASPAFLQSECFVQYAAIQVLQWKAYTRTVSYTSCLSMKKTCQSIRNLSQELASYQGESLSYQNESLSIDYQPLLLPHHTKTMYNTPPPLIETQTKKSGILFIFTSVWTISAHVNSIMSSVLIGQGKLTTWTNSCCYLSNYTISFL